MPYSENRYMVDISDTDYQQYALRFTDAIIKRYANHSSFLPFGIEYESGGGRISYSEQPGKFTLAPDGPECIGIKLPILRKY
jgi:hypothetical protein